MPYSTTARHLRPVSCSAAFGRRYLEEISRRALPSASTRALEHPLRVRNCPTMPIRIRSETESQNGFHFGTYLCLQSVARVESSACKAASKAEACRILAVNATAVLFPFTPVSNVEEICDKIHQCCNHLALAMETLSRVPSPFARNVIGNKSFTAA